MMAARDGGQVDIRFSVANAEVVRQALTNLGKDGEKALRQFDAAAKPVPKSTSLISGALTEAQGKLQEFASRLGPVGIGLTAIGPAGLVAAGAIGAIIAVAVIANQQVNALADKAGRLRDFGETVNLTVRQVQALTIAGAEVGVSGEKVESGVGRMVVAFEELRRGTGNAYEQLKRVNPALVEQLARTRDTAQSITILARAWEDMDTAQRAATSRAIFGRDLGFVRVMNELASAGGLANLERNLGQSITLTQEQAEKLDNLRDAAERLRNSAWERFWSIGAEGVLQQQKESAEQLDYITRKLKELSEIEIRQSVIDFLDRIRRSGGLIGMAATAVANLNRPAETPSPVRDTVAAPQPVADVPMPRARPATAPRGELSPEFQLAQSRERLSLLGSAATPAELLAGKMRELAVATDNWARLQDLGNRALAAFRLAQAQASVSQRQQLGVLTEQELIKLRIAQLDEAQAKGFIRNAEERVAAERIVRKEVKDTMDALEVRASRFPSLTRFAQEASDLDKQIDQAAVGGMTNLTTALTDIATGTKNAGDAFRNLGLQVARSVIEMTVRMTIALPIARALQSALGGWLGGDGSALSILPVPNALGNIFQSGRLVPFARGGVVSSPAIFPMANGGVGLMGEAGPEAIMPLRRGRGGRLGVEMSGGATAAVINATYNIDARGSSMSEAELKAILVANNRALLRTINAGAPARQQQFALLGI